METESDKPSVKEVQRQSRKDELRSILSTGLVIIFAVIFAIGLTTFVFQSYQVDGPSMEKTLNNNDRLIIWKFPRTWARISGKNYVPNRGDVIVFYERNISLDADGNTKQLIKRVIGLPGDHVIVKDGQIRVYNQSHTDGFDPDKTLPYGGKNVATPNGEADYNLKSDEIFVMGDNRPNSLDSRSFGPVKVGDIVGKLVLRVLPLSQVTRF